MDSVHHKDAVAPRALSNDEATELRTLLKTTFDVDNASTARLSLTTREQDEEDASVLLDYAMHMVEDGKKVGHISHELVLLVLPIFDGTMIHDFEECLSTFLHGLPLKPADDNVKIVSKMRSEEEKVEISTSDEDAPPMPPPFVRKSSGDDYNKKIAAKNEKEYKTMGKVETRPALDGPPLPPQFVRNSGEDNKKIAAKEKRRNEQCLVEQIHDEVGPTHLSSIMAGEDTAPPQSQYAKKIASSGGTLEHIHDGGPPVLFEDVAAPGYSKKSALQSQYEKKMPASATPTFNRGDSISIPTREDIEGREPEFASSRPREDSKARSNNRAVTTADVENARAPRPDDTGISRPTLPDLASTHLIPEAFLVVEDTPDVGEVIIATRTLPWWKQRKTQALLCAIFLVVIALSLSLAFQGSEGTTDVPTLSPSTWPSISLAPSSSPSTCSYTISSNKQPVDLQVDKPYRPKVAVDGDNMAIVVDDERWSKTYTIFYSRNKDGEWIIKNTFRMEQYSVGWNSVELSGKTAFVGLPMFSSLSVFNQNEFGFWERMEDPFLQPSSNSTDEDLEHFYASTYLGFGSEPAIDGDLACVGSEDNLFFFHRDGSQWLPFDSIKTYYFENKCAVVGDTVAVFGLENPGSYRANGDYDTTGFVRLYKYAQAQNEMELLQDPIILDQYLHSIESLAFSDDYLIFADQHNFNTKLYIYRREGVNGPFTLSSQNLDISQMLGDQLGLDDDMLVVGSSEGANVQVFLERNGYWEKALALDPGGDSSPYNTYKLSGRSLVAMRGNELFALDVERCAPTPTQTPSISSAPSICYPLEITVVYDMTPHQTSWDLRKVDQKGEGTTILFEMSNDISDYFIPCQGSLDCYKFVDKMCLQQGEYEYNIYDAYDNGSSGGANGIIHPGGYNITTDGVMVANGGKFEYKETTRFYLPSIDQPSAMPTKSAAPTETCHWIAINIVYDEWPAETSYRLEDISVTSEIKEINNHVEADSKATRHSEALCLKEGEYMFTLHDSYGDGMGLGGHYSIMDSVGELIATGGDNFTLTETTIFFIPFASSPSEVPSMSQTPSTSSSPTTLPSSLFPTKSGAPTKTPKPTPYPTFTASTPWEEKKWWTPYPTGEGQTPFPTPTDYEENEDG